MLISLWHSQFLDKEVCFVFFFFWIDSTYTGEKFKALPANLKLCSNTGHEQYCIASRHFLKARISPSSYHDYIPEDEF